MDYNLNLENSNIKKIIINETINKKNNNKKIIQEKVKEKKMRVETKTWGLNDTDLNHETQLNILNSILNKNSEKNKYNSIFISHIKNKISSYKQQDILKKRLNEQSFINFDEVLKLLNSSNMKCHYCSEEMYILYERVRELKQWSLDRVNNNIGHNFGNLVIACLECNLKRRRTNKDAFMFTKNLVITREGL
uniref:HNH domain-containing protein n=1 Tax=viral metagenome TaxID=1070528 RepID=A0A6C0KP38_9ZZZZ